MNLFDLGGRVAAVTGGNGGIGLGMAQGLASAGASIAIWGRNPAKCDAAVEALQDAGADARSWVVDIADEDAVRQAMRDTAAWRGRLDTFIANAAVTADPQPFASLDTADWRQVLDVNLDGTFFCLREASRVMVEQGAPGSLITVSSIGAVNAMPQRESYAAAKAAIIAVTRGLAVELARHDIRANAVLPGWIASDALAVLDDEDDPAARKLRDAVLRRIPLRRFGTSDELGGLAVYLASDASRYHTGDVLTVDGGYRAF